MMQVIIMACGLTIVMTVYMLIYTVIMMVVDPTFLPTIKGEKLLVMKKVVITPYKSSPIVVGWSQHLARLASECGIELTSNGMCGSCPSCLVAQGYMMPNVAVIDPAIDMVGKYSYADLMIELHINK